MSAPIRPEDVEDCIARENSHLAFPPPVEALYQEQISAFRAKALRAGILPIVTVYSCFLFVEALLLPASLQSAVVGHLVIGAGMILVGIGLRARPAPVPRELMAISVPVSLISYIIVQFCYSTDPARDHLHYLVIAVIIYLNVNVRPQFGLALTVSVLLGAAYMLSLVLGRASFESFVVGTAFIMVASYISLVANWRMGKDARRAFLRRLLEQLLREQAEDRAGSDPLTGLANRRRLEAIAQTVWERSAISEESAAVILVDVDHFKDFNDHFGHPEGDRCLRLVAAAIRGQLRGPGDAICRYGGEEFLLLLPGADRARGMRVAERVRRAVAELQIRHIPPYDHITVSVGVMAGPLAYHSFEELTAAADTALYAAKRSGRNQVWPPIGLLEAASVTARRA